MSIHWDKDTPMPEDMKRHPEEIWRAFCEMHKLVFRFVPSGECPRWYCEYPGHFAASKVPFTVEKGKVFVKARVDYISRQIKLIKEDDTPFKLYKEYEKFAQKPGNRYP